MSGGQAKRNPARTPHVIIVGARLAGLCAAYVLQKKGWTCTILEAERHHIGGRVRTMPIGDGLYWEAGAMRIPKEHRIVRKYICGFKELKLRPFVMYSSRTFKFARGTRAITDADIKKQFKLAPAEEGFSSDDLWDLAVKKVARGEPTDAFPVPLSAVEIAQLKSANSFTSDKLINFDRQSLRQLIQVARLPGGQPLSDEAIEFLLFAYGNLASSMAPRPSSCARRTSAFGIQGSRRSWAARRASRTPSSTV